MEASFVYFLLAMAYLSLLGLAADPTALQVLDARGVRLERDCEDKGCALVCTQSVKKGAILMTLPLSKCILAHRSGALKGLQGQTEAM